jgi:hypothetical protein
MPTLEHVLSEALELPSEARAEVGYQLLLSLEIPEESDGVDDRWSAEVQRRLDLIRNGRATLRDWSEVRAEIERALNDQRRPA